MGTLVFENVKIADIHGYEHNAKTHPESQVQQIISYINKFGFNNPILIDENNEIIAGHGRFLAVQAMNLETVPTIKLSHLTDAQKRDLIQALIEKVVYSQEHLIYTITTDATKLQQFISENYENQNTDKMEYIIGDNSITITEKVFLRKYVNTVYDRSKNGVLNVTDNNHLILKAFATAWKYRELYEQDGNVDNVIQKAHTSPRLFYKYLAVSYLSPNIVNKLLKGKLSASVRDVLNKASQSNDFKIQDNIFMV